MPAPLNQKRRFDNVSSQPGKTFLLRGNNLARWRNPANGAVVTRNYEGEDNVCRFEYDPANPSDYATCELHVIKDVGPTASGNCSISRLSCETSFTPVQYSMLESDPALTTPVTTLQRFSTGGFGIGDGSPKPANFHILIGVWFEYDAENPVTIGGIPRSGVFHSGIGGGDVIIIDDLVNGGGWWLFTEFNEFQNYSGGSPLPQSVTWCDQLNRHGMWMTLSTTYRPRLRIRVVTPNYADDDPPNPTLYAPPDGLRYYLHAQAIEGCTGLIPGIVNVAAPVAAGNTPRRNGLKKHSSRSI